jgi:nucleotide-binding universal stress UspA family protein
VTVLAAIDDSDAARPVLDFARRLAALLGTSVEAVHVRDAGSGAGAAASAAAAHIPLRVRDGGVVAALEKEVHAASATALVIGARADAAGAAPAGHIALDIVQSLACAVVVVPPDAADRPLRRVMVAVEGDGESHALRRLFEHLGDQPTPEVIALHVIEPAAAPPFADSPVFEADAYEREFRIRVASAILDDPSRVRFEMRVGAAEVALLDAARELDVDVIVLAWHGNLSGAHGRLVRETLAGAPVPVALYAFPA